jgi:hypothetical protein
MTPGTLASRAELDQLRGHLAQLIAALDEEKDAHWSSWMRSSDEMIAGGDLGGVEHFLGAFGGMGSFNDLASERCSAIAAKAYRLARQIQDRCGDE